MIFHHCTIVLIYRFSCHCRGCFFIISNQNFQSCAKSSSVHQFTGHLIWSFNMYISNPLEPHQCTLFFVASFPELIMILTGNIIVLWYVSLYMYIYLPIWNLVSVPYSSESVCTMYHGLTSLEPHHIHLLLSWQPHHHGFAEPPEP